MLAGCNTAEKALIAIVDRFDGKHATDGLSIWPARIHTNAQCCLTTQPATCPWQLAPLHTYAPRAVGVPKVPVLAWQRARAAPPAADHRRMPARA